jgi:hypothetical protein
MALRIDPEEPGLQPPDVSAVMCKELRPIIAKLPAGYRIEQGGSIEESGKANRALAPLFPVMIALTLIQHGVALAPPDFRSSLAHAEYRTASPLDPSYGPVFAGRPR